MVVAEVDSAYGNVFANDTIAVVSQTAPFSATSYDASNTPLTGRTYLWETGDTAVVTVAPNGVATAIGLGYVYIAANDIVSDSAMVEVTGATVNCLRPWALPELWFVADPYGRAIRARYGPPNEFSTVWPEAKGDIVFRFLRFGP